MVGSGTLHIAAILTPDAKISTVSRGPPAIATFSEALSLALLAV
jgi:hypothetical protein